MTLLPRMLILVILISGLVDLPRKLDLGPVTMLGLLTAIYAGTSWMLVFAHAQIPRAASVVGWFVLFLVWPFVVLIWHPLLFHGVQNLLTYYAFVGLMLLSAMESYHSPYLFKYVGDALTWTPQLAGVLFAVSLLHQYGILKDDFTAIFVMGPRAFGMYALFGVAWYLASWRYGSRTGLWWAVAATLMIGLSLSRMALFAALALFPLATLQLGNIRGWARVIVCLALMAGISYSLFVYVEPIRSRFVEGDMSLQVGGVAVNAAGRGTFWQATLTSFWESPWIGKGAGSAEDVVSAATARLGESKSSHPHNDYLRILHDYGSIGLGLWLLGFCGLLKTIWQAWHRANQSHRPQARLYLATFLALVAVAMVMLTDNIIVYIHMMGPLGVVVGTSLGALSRERVQSLSMLAPISAPLRVYSKGTVR